MEEITKLTILDYKSVLIAVFVILAGAKTCVSLFEWVIDKLGIETKWTRKKADEHKQITLNTNAIKELSKIHAESVKQSIIHDEKMKNDILSLSNNVKEIAEKINMMQIKIDHTEMAKLKNQLLSYYKKYKDIGEWDKFESDVFWDLYNSYISHGGNSFVKQDIEPVMRNLNVKN